MIEGFKYHQFNSVLSELQFVPSPPLQLTRRFGTMRTWSAKIRLSNGGFQDVYVQADNYFNAVAIIEAQYGRGSIVFGPSAE
jgi:hypothetical protein